MCILSALSHLSLTSITPSKQIFTPLSSSSLPFLNQTHKSTYLKSQTYKPTNLKPQAHITKPKNQFPCLSHKPTKSLICFFKGISPSHLSLIVEWGMTAVPFSRGGGRLLAPISGRLRRRLGLMVDDDEWVLASGSLGGTKEEHYVGEKKFIERGEIKRRICKEKKIKIK